MNLSQTYLEILDAQDSKDRFLLPSIDKNEVKTNCYLIAI